MTTTWLIISCNSRAEASKIGGALLKKRLAACYDIVPKNSAFFWPPQKGKISRAAGTFLFATTIQRHVAKARKLAASKHSDKVPFIGTMKIDDVDPKYYHWLTRELAPHA